MDLENLSSVKAAAEEFLSKECRLGVLWNNAAVVLPPAGSKTKQGWDLQLGVNCLVATAKISPPRPVRVMFVTSSAAYLFAPTGGVEMLRLMDANEKDPIYMYGVSKAGNALYTLQFAKLYRKDGVVAVVGPAVSIMLCLRQLTESASPRAATPEPYTRICHGMSLDQDRSSCDPLQFDPVYGSYTELFGGLSPKITLEETGAETGAWLIPWGRIGKLRPDIEEAGKSKADGGSGIAEEFWSWSEEQVTDYL